jgi:hypothetical protein
MRACLKSFLCLFAAVAICTAGGLKAAPPVPSPIPLEKGNRWTYEGKIETTLSGTFAASPATYATNICWVMEIIDSTKTADAQAAIVSGLPDELPWHEPTQVPRFCVLLNFSNHVYQFKAKNEADARSMLQDVISQPGKFSRQAQDFNELFQLPLAKDSRWGGDLQREDGWYSWRVEKAQPAKLQVEGNSGNPTVLVYTLAYRTNPEHLLMDIAPGLGITRFIYEHHGTVAEVDVRLVSFKRPH